MDGTQKRKKRVKPFGVRFVHGYVNFINRFKIAVLLLWCVAVGLSAWVAPRFIGKTSDAFDPPANSDAATANALFSAAFPEGSIQSSLALYITFNSNSTSNETLPSSILSDALQNFTFAIKDQVYNVGVPAYWNQTGTGVSNASNFIASFESYYTLQAEGLGIVAAQLLSPSGNSTIISIILNAPYTSNAAIDFSNWLIDEIPKVQEQTATANLSMTLTGVPAFIDVMQDSAESDLALMDGIVMPIAMLILAYILRTLRLMILPLVSIGTSTACSFALMYVVASYMNVTSVSSSLMMSILVAMSIDYSLFLLSRYREELFAGKDPMASVEIMLQSAGHTIFVSGFTLAGCFLGLVVLPLMMMKTIGIACAIAITTTLLVNLTLIPSALLLFNNFFARCVEPFNCFGYVIKVGARPSKEEQKLFNDEDANSDFQSDSDDSDDEYEDRDKETDALLVNEKGAKIADPEKGSDLRAHRLQKKIRRLRAEREDEEMKSSFWYRWGNSFLLRFPFNIIIVLVVVGFTIYFDLFALNPATTDGLYLDLPRGYEVTKAYAQMCTDFGYGTVYPYNLLLQVDPTNPNMSTVMSEEFFEAAANVLKQLAPQLPNTTIDNFAGIMLPSPFPFYNESTPYQTLANCIKDPSYSSFLCPPLLFGYKSLVNANTTATYVIIELDWDPLGVGGGAWLNAARAAIGSLQNTTGIQMSLSGIAADSLDAIDAVYDQFPLMIYITCGVVFVFVAVAFGSILIPLRATLTIGLTLAWVYGFADMTYEHGMLNFLHFYGLQGTNAVMWLAPVVSFSIIVGIGLDYDIFLLVRTREYRLSGHSTSDSILLGLYKTGRIITAAGIIMAIAFSGLLFSSIPSLNQLAFYLVFAVLFDTFIVRSSLVPALMGMLGEASWWPSKMPSPIGYDS